MGELRVGLVSNCMENTRPLLADLGVSELADAMVQSCEVGCAKPDARIYHHALSCGLGNGIESALSPPPVTCSC